MGRYAAQILELIGLYGLVGAIAFVKWTKLTLGAAVVVVGAFFPQLQASEKTPASGGQATLNILNIAIKMRGSLRIFVIISGIVIILATFIDAYDEKFTSEGDDFKEKFGKCMPVISKVVTGERKSLSLDEDATYQDCMRKYLEMKRKKVDY